eukprot:784478-Rhodomonas_salina.1
MADQQVCVEMVTDHLTWAESREAGGEAAMSKGIEIKLRCVSLSVCRSVARSVVCRSVGLSLGWYPSSAILVPAARAGERMQDGTCAAR